jgi:hypothetical protein
VQGLRVDEWLAEPLHGRFLAKKEGREHFAPDPGRFRLVRGLVVDAAELVETDAGGDVHIGHGLSVCESLEDCGELLRRERSGVVLGALHGSSLSKLPHPQA